MNEPRGTPNSVSASAGMTLRIIPMVIPTSTLSSTERKQATTIDEGHVGKNAAARDRSMSVGALRRS